MSYIFKVGNQRIRTLMPGTPVAESIEWVRSSEWLPVPAIADQEFAGLIAVYPTDSNFVALSATVVSGSSNTAMSYSVDWGDGNTQIYTSSAVAEYSHSYDLLPESSYVETGSYRQAWVRVVPTGSAQYLPDARMTIIDLQKKHSRSGLPSVPTVPWLDCILSGSHINSIASRIGGTVTHLHYLERCWIASGSLSGSITSVAGMFYNCYSLQSVPLFNTSNCSNFSSMFNGCYSLQSIPLFNTSNGSDFSSMFYNCYSLHSIPLLDTSKGSTFTNMFSSCYSLESIPPLNTSSGSNFSGMFTNCYSLQTIPLLDTSKGSNFLSMFANCYSLQSIPPLNTSSGSNFSNMFYGCYSLKSIPLLDTSNGTNFNTMFNSCYSLQSIPPLNTSSGSLFTLMLANTTLRIGALSGSRSTIDYSGLQLSRAEILRIFDNLGTAMHPSASITCSLNHGSADLLPSDSASVIAKGWVGVKY